MDKITQILLALLSLSLTLELGSTHKRWSVFRSMFKRIKYGVPSGGDPGQPLFLTPYIESGRTEEGRLLSLVGALPGANVKSYSGYLTVNKTHNSNLFFWFFPAQVQPEDAAVLLWLQGGPGGSSMFGLFVEHGPYVVHKNLTLSERSFPWTSKFSVLYIDNPVGTGFSFTDDEAGYTVNQDDVGRDLYSALTQFFQLFPDYQKNDFYATGESYAGKYVPAIGYYIHTHNPTAKIKINFKGIAIGDGLCDPEMMLGGYAQLLYQIGLVDDKQREFVQQQTDLVAIYIQQKKWREAFEVFDVLLNGDQIETPSYFQNWTGCSNYYNFMDCQEPADQEYYGQLLSFPEVRKSIHVGNLTFHNGSAVEKHLLEDVMKTIKPWLAILMDNYRVLLYSGQLDIIVGAPLTERFLPTVPWAKVEEYKNAERVVWRIHARDPDVAGYVRQAGEFYQIIVRGGGHILPYDQPERSLDMMDRFISGKGWKPNRY
ncbi:probable serine carboxypeptidase CPVL [Rhineura floridana]|uniref:probable serine carboxypeptidase CPVL n=1 Tax=Rhineura floridana TaxID=261503 RepID=UPI002AC81058|nr:probable serine carboxypeptidase CPVL [Rhineura floridana]XP_061442031.1 probable serine carboxypeptidase CPVL [Rhineura floridana]XP_061442032.1 probable serine carboxypeptidase CPVL [Rhineura floridana]